MTLAPVYRIRDLTKRLGPRFTLQIDDLGICGGELFCLLGPTGSGKSTLLRLLAGLTDPSGGLLEWNGHRLDGSTIATERQRRLAIVPQSPHMLRGNVRYNVEYGLRVRGAADRRDRVEQVLRQLDLSGVATQSAGTLSGGQRQLVALARALVLDADVLLLDEPTAHLDPARVALVEQCIQSAHSKGRPTVVWATHNLFQARRVADRVGLLWNGCLIETANAETFFSSPTDPRTRDFVAGRLVY